MTVNFLNKIKAEYNARHNATINEINSLQTHVKSLLATLDIPSSTGEEISHSSKEHFLTYTFQTSTINKLEKDIEILKLVMADKNAQNDASFAFKTNKLNLLFNCAKDVLNKYGLFQLLNRPLMDNLHEKNTGGFDFENTNKNSTSYLNCVQTAFLTTFALAAKKDSFQDLNLAQNYKIYDVQTSPVVQTTAFSKNYVPTTYTLKDDTKVDITKWFYYYKDDKSPTQGELLTPTLGYQFGGSRSDARYHDKTFRSEDCSSAASKWLGLKQSLTTADYELIYLGKSENNNYNDIIKPITNLSELAPGHIFVTRTYDITKNPAKNETKYAKGGHIGVISEIFEPSQNLENIKVEVISYNRDMPMLEGLVIENTTFSNKAVQYYFFEVLGNNLKTFIDGEL